MEERPALELSLPDDLSQEDWLQIGQQLRNMDRALPWMIGDWVRFGERQYGETYQAAMEKSGLSHQTLRNQASVARKFELSRRRDNLSFGHHAEVAALTEKDADALLDRAEDEQLSVKAFRQEVARFRRDGRITAALQRAADLGVTNKRYTVVYAHPPWRY